MPKKRSPGEGGLHYDKVKGLWRGRYDDGFHPDGRRRQREVSARTQTVARERLKQKLAEIAEYGTTLDRTVTVAAWAEHYVETDCRMRLKPNSLATTESLMRNWIVPLLGRRRISELKPSDVRLVHKAVFDAGLATGTARKAHEILSGMLSAAKADGLVTRNVVDDVKPPEVIAKNPRGSLTTEQALAVLAASANVEGTRWWVAVLDGIRQSERLGALIEGLDLDAGTLRVDWQLEELRSEHGCEPLAEGRWSCLTKRGSSCPQRRFKVKPSLEYIHLYGRLALIRPKSGKSRTVPLIPPVVAVLREYLEATKDRPNPTACYGGTKTGAPTSRTRISSCGATCCSGLVSSTRNRRNHRKTEHPGHPVSQPHTGRDTPPRPR